MLNEKSQHFSQNFIFFCTKLTFFAPKIYIGRNTCDFASKFARHYFITEQNDILKQNKNFPTNETL